MALFPRALAASLASALAACAFDFDQALRDVGADSGRGGATATATATATTTAMTTTSASGGGGVGGGVINTTTTTTTTVTTTTVTTTTVTTTTDSSGVGCTVFDCNQPAPCNVACAANTYCAASGQCLPCGTFDTPCCPGAAPCSGALACYAGICHCGDPGEVCCADAKCNNNPAMLTCRSGTCQQCCGSCLGEPGWQQFSFDAGSPDCAAAVRESCRAKNGCGDGSAPNCCKVGSTPPPDYPNCIDHAATWADRCADL